jgi:hypothetical protein
VSRLEGVDDRQHSRGLGLAALEGFDGQREPRCVGEQSESDLRFRRRSLENPVREAVTGIGLEVQGAHVEQDQ